MPWTVNGYCGGTNNIDPTVSLTAPTVLTYTAPASITISANATDSEGSISKVEFYNGTILLNSDATAPYSYAWTGVAVGNYAITAKAYDNLNLTTTSTVINVTVNAAGGACTSPQYVAGTTYATGASVQNNGKKYTCTVGGWCSSSAAWTYAPGTGTAWSSAWNDLGTCTSRMGDMEINTSIYPNPVTDGAFIIESEFEVKSVLYNAVGGEILSLDLEKGKNEINNSFQTVFIMLK